MADYNTSEEAILSAVPGFQKDAENAVAIVDEATDAVETTTESNTEDNSIASSEVTTSNETAKVDPTAKQTETKETQKQNTNTTNPGDLVDRRTGEVLAKAGAERRVFEKAAKHVLGEFQKEFAVASERIQGLEAQVRNYQEIHKFADQNQINPNEHAYALEMMAAYKRDPIGTVKMVLTEAMAQGYDLGDSIGLTPSVVQKMVQQSVAPLLEDRNRIVQQQQQQQQIEQAYHNFISRFPDAKVHENVIGELLQRNPQLSLEEAYYQLRLAASERKLDWSKPLHGQMQIAQKQQTNQMQQQRTIPAGRSSGNNIAATNVAPTDKSYNDIVLNAMREAGMDISWRS